MDNNKLKIEFEKISIIYNPFDAYLSLMELEKEYKKSNFFKTTKMSIQNAYKLFIEQKTYKGLNLLNNIQNSEYLGNLITDALNNIDSSTLNNFIDKITTTFDVENLKNLQGDLQSLASNVIPN